jgi:hypothetical protein
VPRRGRGATFGVRFDELAFTEDLAHATPAGRDVALAARRRLEAEGADPREFKRCDPEARDGTRLPNCLTLGAEDAASRARSWSMSNAWKVACCSMAW